VAIRGENIGTAYVRILADGSGLDRSIREEFRQHEDAFHQAGRKNSEAFNDGFDEQMERWAKKDVKGLVAGLNRKSGQMDAVAQQMADGFLKPLRKQLLYRHGDEIGGELARDIEKGFRDSGGDLDWVDNYVEGIERHISRITGDIKKDELRQEAQKWADQLKMGERWAREIDDSIHEQQLRRDKEFEDRATKLHQNALAIREAADKAFWKNNMDLDRDFELNHTRLAKIAEKNYAHELALDEDRKRSIKSVREEYQQFVKDYEKIAKGEEVAGRSVKGMRTEIDALRDRMVRLGQADDLHIARLRSMNDELYHLNPRLREWDTRLGKVGDTVGRAFGKGSRNNFINVLGGVAGSIASFPRLFTKAGEGINLFFGNLRSAFDAARDEGASFADAMGASFRTMGTGLAKGLAVAGGGILGGFVFLGPLISLVSEAAGAVAALAATIGMGLAGAAGAAAGAFVPLVAGVAAFALGLGQLQGDAKKAMTGLSREFADMWLAAGRGLQRNGTIATDLRTLTSSIRDDFEPVLADAAAGMGKAFHTWITGAQDSTSAWSQFMDSMSSGFMEKNTQRIGSILTNSFDAVLNTLRALEPLTNRFLGWLDDVAKKWSDWTGSSDGQRQMLSFFHDAGDSAKVLGQFLESAAKFLGTLISAGNEAGDGLFGSMTDEINRWNDALSTTAGRDSLRKWFSDSAQFARDLGSVLKTVVQLFGTLDTEASRGLLNTMIQTLNNSLRVLNGVLGPISAAFDGLNKATGGLAGTLTASALVLPMLGGAFGKVGTRMGGFITNMRSAETRMTALRGAAGKVAGIGGLALLASNTGKTTTAFGELKRVAGGALLGFEVGGPIGAAVGAGAVGLYDLYKNTSKVSETMASGKRTVQDYASSLDAVSAAATKATGNMILQAAQESGALSQARNLGISTRTLIGATLGHKDSLEAVNRALQSGKTYIVAWTDSMGGAHTAAVKNDAQLKRLKETVRENGGELDKVAKKQLDMANNKELLSFISDQSAQWRAASKAERQHIIDTEDLHKVLKGLPKKVATKIDAEGIVPTTKGIAKVMKMYGLPPKKIQTIIDALGVDTTVKQVKKVMATMDDANKKKSTAHVDGDTSKAEKSFKGLETLTKNLLGIKMPAVAKINGDNSKATAEINQTRDQVRSLITGNYSVTIHGDGSQAAQAIANVRYDLNALRDKTIYIHTVHTGSGQAKYSPTATGGIFNYASRRLIGEAGPEAVVPLNRPLGAVDPAVRWLSAIAQGKGDAMASGGVVGGGRTVDVGGITVVSPSADPKAVAVQTLNQLIAAVI